MFIENVLDLQKWTTVGYKDIQTEVQDHQLWKKKGTGLVSKYNGAILGVHETEGLVVFLEDNEMITPTTKKMITPISIEEGFEFPVPCKKHR